ncbi:alpha/beta fold hydrolase [Methylobrevis albus]|uniref:Alpha/beta hydrolase n=1 Tax=Methylobrevis albus TaxID=2793297 RepID=A0A931MY17_9HYPH|nr:alpha/beta hydrolase [Methylobrevis albus]MBH0237907.1 alpha/beta hydrolase [Methylobrevis albus]
MSLKQTIAAAALSTTGLVSAALAQDRPVIILVHGAWANGSSWERVVPMLQAEGLTVHAVHNSAASFESDVAATRRVIDDQPGAVILVGHSYGGAVITEAGTNDKVRALVYVAAFAPAAGESVNSIVGQHGQPVWFGEIHADAGGYLTWASEGMAKYFAPDLPAGESALLAAVQAPLFAGAFDGKVSRPAFAEKPSWFLIADQDQIIPPPLQQFFAARMGATVKHAAASHAVILSQPGAVAEAILAAVGGSTE